MKAIYALDTDDQNIMEVRGNGWVWLVDKRSMRPDAVVEKAGKINALVAKHFMQRCERMWQGVRDS